jgi:hypothetical protein
MTEPLHQSVNPYTANEQFKKNMQEAVNAINLMADQKILAVFNSPEGDALLDIWDDIYVRQAVILPKGLPGENEMREGRNAFIRHIRMIVNRARGIQ